MPFSKMLIPLKTNKYATYSCTILLLLLMLNGCATAPIPITQNWEAKVPMTKADAVQSLKQHLVNFPDLSVDDKHISFSFQEQVQKQVSSVYTPGVGMIPIYSYPYETRLVSIVFENVGFIAKSGDYINIYDKDAKCINCKTIKAAWIGEKPFVSALLALCPNVK